MQYSDAQMCRPSHRRFMKPAPGNIAAEWSAHEVGATLAVDCC